MEPTTLRSMSPATIQLKRILVPVDFSGPSSQAVRYAARHPDVEKLVLMAPAFCFLKRWMETLGPSTMERWKSTGSLEFFHYGEGRAVPLGYQLIQDAERYEDYPGFTQPAIIFHGKNDTVVPAEYSVAFAGRHRLSSRLGEAVPSRR